MKTKNYTIAKLFTLLLFITATSIAQTFTTSPISNPYGLSTNPSEGVYQPTFVDIDNDGDQDLFIGRSNSSARKIEFYENIGTATNPNFSTAPIINPFNLVVNSPTPYNNFVLLPAFGDIDGDGDFDLLVGMGNNTDNFEYYENNGTTSLADFATATIHNIPDAVAPAFIDIDTDGDQDLFFGNNPNYANPNINVQFYKNLGTPTSSNFVPTTLSPLVTGNGATYPALGDLDLDGEIDMIVCENSNDALLYLGDGTGNFNSTGILLTGVEAQQSPALVDIDGDGDLDLFIGMETQLVMYKNTDLTLSNGTYIDEMNFSVFPNPTTGVLNIQSEYNINTIEVFNILGNRVLSFNTELHQIDISDLHTGIYITRAILDTGDFITKRIQKK